MLIRTSTSPSVIDPELRLERTATGGLCRVAAEPSAGSAHLRRPLASDLSDRVCAGESPSQDERGRSLLLRAALGFAALDVVHQGCAAYVNPTGRTWPHYSARAVGVMSKLFIVSVLSDCGFRP